MSVVLSPFTFFMEIGSPVMPVSLMLDVDVEKPGNLRQPLRFQKLRAFDSVGTTGPGSSAARILAQLSMRRPHEARVKKPEFKSSSSVK